MKKYIFISAVALFALAACSKVTIGDGIDARREVSFQVANYTASTKANVALEEFDSFNTYAIFHSSDTENPFQWFMEDEKVIAKMNGETISKWVPEHPFYWPKTGNISFYSYTGTRKPTVWPTPKETGPNAVDIEKEGNVMFQFGAPVPLPDATSDEPEYDMSGQLDIRGIPVPVDPDDPSIGYYPADNIMVADPAYQLTVTSNSDGENVKFDQNDPGFTGVPTLFHHMLAKIRFQVVLDASKSTDRTTWTVTIPEQTLLEVPRYGYLKVKYPRISSGRVGLTVDQIEWHPFGDLNGEKFVDRIKARSMELTATGPNVTEQDTNNLIWVPEEPVSEDSDVLKPICEREFVVIPRYCELTAFHFGFTMKSEYTDGQTTYTGVTEKVTVSKTMHDLGTDEWLPNHIYTYKIIIKTNGEVLFQPHFVQWEEDTPTMDL